MSLTGCLTPSYGPNLVNWGIFTSVHTPFPAFFILEFDSDRPVGRVLRALSSSPSGTCFHNLISDYGITTTKFIFLSIPDRLNENQAKTIHEKLNRGSCWRASWAQWQRDTLCDVHHWSAEMGIDLDGIIAEDRDYSRLMFKKQDGSPHNSFLTYLLGVTLLFWTPALWRGA